MRNVMKKLGSPAWCLFQVVVVTIFYEIQIMSAYSWCFEKRLDKCLADLKIRYVHKVLRNYTEFNDTNI